MSNVDKLIKKWREVEHFSEASTARARKCADELEHAITLDKRATRLGRCVYRRSPHTKIESCLDWKPLK